VKASFTLLAATDLLLLGVTLILGLAASGSGEPARAGLLERHTLLGLAALLFTCFVHVIAFTYLVVFSRMAQEAVRDAGMDADGYAAVTDLKRRMGRWMAMGVFITLLTGATGSLVTGGWRLDPIWHMAVAMIGWLANAVAFVVERGLIGDNVRLTERLYAALTPAAPHPTRPPDVG